MGISDENITISHCINFNLGEEVNGLCYSFSLVAFQTILHLASGT